MYISINICYVYIFIYIFAHFQTSGHSGFINDTEIRFIDKTDPSDPTRREDFWIDTLKTRYPQGLNN